MKLYADTCNLSDWFRKTAYKNKQGIMYAIKLMKTSSKAVHLIIILYIQNYMEHCFTNYELEQLMRLRA